MTRGAQVQRVIRGYQEQTRSCVYPFGWLGHLGLPCIFDGRHIHEIEVLGPERVRYMQREEFTGVLVPLLGGMLRDAERGFGAMNAALKERAESLASKPG